MNMSLHVVVGFVVLILSGSAGLNLVVLVCLSFQFDTSTVRGA